MKNLCMNISQETFLQIAKANVVNSKHLLLSMDIINIIYIHKCPLGINLGFAGGLYDHDTKLTRFGGADVNLYGYVLNPFGGFSPMTGMPSWTDKPLFDALQTRVEIEVAAVATATAAGGMCLAAPPLYWWGVRNPETISFSSTVGDILYGGLSPEPPTTPTQAIGAGLHSVTDSLFGY